MEVMPAHWTIREWSILVTLVMALGSIIYTFATVKISFGFVKKTVAKHSLIIPKLLETDDHTEICEKNTVAFATLVEATVKPIDVKLCNIDQRLKGMDDLREKGKKAQAEHNESVMRALGRVEGELKLMNGN